MRLRDLALARPRYGYRHPTILLRREGWHVNAKRVYRLYREEGLTMRVKRRKKLVS
jgi:putative transposase